MNKNIKIAKELVKIAGQLIKASKKINADEDFSHYYDDKIQKQKSILIKVFDEILRNGKPQTGYVEFGIRQIYDILTDSNKKKEQCQWFTEEVEKNYLNEINKLKPIMDNNWANFSPKKQNDDNKDQEYNTYYTFQFKQLQDLENFINFIKDVKNVLQDKQMIESGQVPYFTCKTLNNLKELISHNDTFKVFYSYKQDKNEIQNIIKHLISKNNLRTTSRPYNNGKDVKQTIIELCKKYHDGTISREQYKQMKINIGSFGQRLSKYITNRIINIINKSKQLPQNKTLTAQKCYDWFKKHFIDLLKQAVNKLS